MKKHKFVMWYEDGAGLEEWAQSAIGAAILSMAKRIRDGLPHHVDSIETEDGQHLEISITSRPMPLEQ